MSNSSGGFSKLASFFAGIAFILAAIGIGTDGEQNEVLRDLIEISKALKARVEALEASRRPSSDVRVVVPRRTIEEELTTVDDEELRVGDVIPTEINAVETVSGNSCWVLDDGSFVVEKIDGEWALVRYDRQGPAPQPRVGEACPNGTRAVRPVYWLQSDKRGIPERRRRKQEQREAAARMVLQ